MINFNDEKQLLLLNELKSHYKELPFSKEKTDDLRYYFHNNWFGEADGVFYFFMLRYLKPKQIIEIGSGFSSCVLLDSNELFFNNTIKCTFIEPEPTRLLNNIKKTDSIVLLQSNIQNVELDVFKDLEPNDILFVDSSHISSYESDVNYIFFKILPLLKTGVYIHFHDIFPNFEYPVEWIRKNDKINETYLLHAFLMYNTCFSIEMFPSYLMEKYPDKISFLNSGGSIYLKKNN